MLQFRNVVEYPGTYTAVIDVIYPAGSWSIDGINVGQTDIIQLCPIKIICGPGNLTFHFVVDEWFMVTGGQMTQISAGGFTASQRMDQPLYFGQLDSGIKMSDKVMWGNMTTWISSAIESAMNGTVYYSTQGAKFCNMMRWGTLPDGFYYPNITSNALSAALSSMAHYVVLQYNGSATTDCEYYGIQNAGKISADNTTVIVCLAVGIVLAISLLYNMLGLFLNNTTDWTASKVNSKGSSSIGLF